MFLSDADLALFRGLGECLVILGLVGAVSVFFSSQDRRMQERTLSMLFTLMASGGVAILWRADNLENVNRDLSLAQQAALSKTISQFSTVKFRVLTSRGNSEAHSLALKIVEAVEAGSGTMLPFYDELVSLPKGVVIFFNPKDADLGRKVYSAIGRELMKARIVGTIDSKADLEEGTLWIMVGEKP